MNPMSKRGFIGPLVIVLVGLLSIAGLIGLGMYLGKKSSGPTATNPVVTVQSSPAPSPSPTSSETANWKTFKSNNYEISYPLDKYSERGGSSNIALWPGPIILTPNDSFPGNYQIAITVFDNKENLSPENPASLFQSSLLYSHVCDQEAKLNKFKTIYLDGRKAFKIDNCIGGLSGTREQIITIENNKLFEIDVDPTDQGDIANKLLDQILSTFKFTQ
ncbi:MAG: hypothetical protein ACHQVK_01145 [Candidatus Paceibacterales bacterium]